MKLFYKPGRPAGSPAFCTKNEAMAQWLDERLPGITRKYLARSEQDLMAKH
jgi:hypothetical protein